MAPRQPSHADIAQDLDWDARLRTLETKFAVWETQRSASQAVRGRRWQLWVLLVSAALSLGVGIILAAFKFAKDTKDAAGQRSQVVATQVVASSQPSTSDTFAAGAEAGATKALADFQRTLEEKDLVIVPRSVVRAKPKK